MSGDLRFKSSKEEDARTLFVSGIPLDVRNKEDVLDLSIFKNAVDCRLIMDRMRGGNKGFCYVVFESENDAEDAYDKKDDAKMDGRVLRIDYRLLAMIYAFFTSNKTKSMFVKWSKIIIANTLYTGEKSSHRPPAHREPRRSRSRDRYDRYDRRDRYDPRDDRRDDRY